LALKTKTSEKFILSNLLPKCIFLFAEKSETGNFEALKNKMTQNTNSVLIFDGFDELLSNSTSVDNVIGKKGKLFEVIDMLYASDNSNTIVRTYTTAGTPILRINFSPSH